MKKVNRGAVRREKHRSHTDRYLEEPEHQADCIRQGTPEWLVFHSTGHTSRRDGQKGDEFP